MNVDMITTFLNDFSTFWKNIWEFLKPIFNMINGEWSTKEKDGEINHLKNLNELAKSFGGDWKDGSGYQAVKDAADGAETGSSAGSSDKAK